MSASVIETIRKAWGWTGIDPEKVIDENAFGNLLIRDVEGKIWRLCPEDVYCRIVANDNFEYQKLIEDPEFLEDWNMEKLVAVARDKLGSLSDNRKYCLKIPGILGGEYGWENLGTITLEEMISFSGEIANQIKDLPDGAQVKIDITDQHS
jgi:hypothetical protein